MIDWNRSCWGLNISSPMSTFIYLLLASHRTSMTYLRKHKLNPDSLFLFWCFVYCLQNVCVCVCVYILNTLTLLPGWAKYIISRRLFLTGKEKIEHRKAFLQFRRLELWKIFDLFIWLGWVFVAVSALSRLAVEQGCSTVAMHRLPIAAASLVMNHGLQAASSVAAERGLNRCSAWA